MIHPRASRLSVQISPLLLALALLGEVLGLAACSPQETPDAAFDSYLGDPDCDPILPGFAYTRDLGGLPPACALPWPSSLYLKDDPTRKTGYTLSFGSRSLPENKQGIPIDPAAYRKRDGYSVGTPLLLVIPGIDLTGFATEDHLERSLEKDAPLQWFEVSGSTVRRIPYWVERDSLDLESSRATIFVRPAVILKEATRYVVALGAIKDCKWEADSSIARLCQTARWQDCEGIPVLRDRQARFDKTFSFLEGQGLARDSLALAWEFHTASSESMHGDLLAMRDDALQRMGAKGPALTVEKVIEYAKSNDGTGRPVNEYIGLELTGTFEVPSYLEATMISGFMGSQLHRDSQGKPSAQGTRKPRFWVRIPHTALGGPPHGLVLYGHGLLGSGESSDERLQRQDRQRSQADLLCHRSVRNVGRGRAAAAEHSVGAEPLPLAVGQAASGPDRVGSAGAGHARATG
jgi:hypothetical protein